MAKSKLLASVVVMLLLASLMSAVASARIPQTIVNFSLIASGECVIVDDLFNQFDFGIGTGTLSFIGHSNVRPLPGQASWYQAHRNFYSQNSATVNWNGHSISLSFSLREPTHGFFGDNIISDGAESPMATINPSTFNDYIFLGISPFYDISTASMLRYQGIYTNQAGTQQMSGCAFVYSMSAPIDAGIFTVIYMVLIDRSGGILEAIWLSQDYNFGAPIGLVHAANPFVSSVSVTTP